MTESFDFHAEHESVSDAYLKRSADDFLLFVRGLVIPAAHGRCLFNDCIQDFQVEAFQSLAPSLQALRRGDVPPIQRFWIERTKKAGKDSDLAACLLWLMAFPKKPLKCQVVAATSVQAGIIENRAVELLHYNPWLRKRVEIVARVMRSRLLPREVWTHIEPTSTGKIAHGEAPEILVLNELVHVDRWPVMESHMNNADGVARGVVVVSTNAGVKGEPAWRWRKQALSNPALWKPLILSRVAPWISKQFVEEAKKRDPVGAESARLWGGQWISGVGDAISEDVINRSFCLDGPLSIPEPGWIYLASLDMGETHDHSGVTVVGVNVEKQMVKVVWLRGWVPSVPNDKGVLEIDADDVEQTLVRVIEKFNVMWMGYDPAAGGRFIAQRLRKRGINTCEMTFSSTTNQTAMAVAFVQLMNSGRLQCWDDAEGRLRRDFGKFSIEHKPPNRYKLVAVSDEHGHADVGVALVICLPKAVELMGGLGCISVDAPLIDIGDEPLSDKELEDMPDDLRGIYDSVDDNPFAREELGWEDRELF